LTPKTTKVILKSINQKNIKSGRVKMEKKEKKGEFDEKKKSYVKKKK